MGLDDPAVGRDHVARTQPRHVPDDHVRARDVLRVSVPKDRRPRRAEPLQGPDGTLGISLGAKADRSVQRQHGGDDRRVHQPARCHGETDRPHQHQRGNRDELVLQDLGAGAAIHLWQPVRAVARAAARRDRRSEAGR